METGAYLIALLCAFWAGLIIVRGKERRFPYCTFFTGVALAACLVAQLLNPALLAVVERSPLILSGEWWRILTALFFQDGGLGGGGSNIVFLILIGSVAEQALTRRAWLFVYFGSGLLGEAVALSWQPVGAGNSIAVFGLAAALCAYAVVCDRRLFARVLAVASALSAAFLFLNRDIHGAAYFIGAALYGALSLRVFLQQSANMREREREPREE